MTPQEPVPATIASIARIGAVDDRLRSFITVDEVAAMVAANAAAERAAAGRPLGPLDGVPIAVKDCIDTAGLRTTSGSMVHADRVPTADAVVVSRLRAAGLVIVGKTNMTEFACGTAGANPFFGDVANPHDLSRWAGGSSGGSAAAVAAGSVPLALGTDTSCSVRYPAAVCGIVGFKPSWGRVSNDGVTTIAVKADHVGTLTRSVADAAALLAVIQDDGWGNPAVRFGRDVRGLRAAVLGGGFIERCDADVSTSFDAALGRVSSLGIQLSRWDPQIDLSAADDHLTACCSDLVTVYGDELRSAPDGAIGDVLRGWLALFERIEPQHYERALQRRTELRRQLAEAFGRFDVLLCPTARRPAGRYEDLAASDRDDRSGNCSLFGFTGLPAISVPIEPSAQGLPIGLQVIGADGADETVLAVANALVPGSVPVVDPPTGR